MQCRSFARFRIALAFFTCSAGITAIIPILLLRSLTDRQHDDDE